MAIYASRKGRFFRKGGSYSFFDHQDTPQTRAAIGQNALLQQKIFRLKTIIFNSFLTDFNSLPTLF